MFNEFYQDVGMFQDEDRWNVWNLISLYNYNGFLKVLLKTVTFPRENEKNRENISTFGALKSQPEGVRSKIGYVGISTEAKESISGL